MKELKSTIAGVLFLVVALVIFVISEYITKDLRILSTASVLIFVFSVTGVLSILGKDKLIDDFYRSINRLIDRLKK